MKLSIILPVYNQADHVRHIVDIYRKTPDVLSCSVEIICVVNGTTDASYQTLLQLTKNNLQFRIYNLKKGGWGRAVKFGLQKARGDFVCYTNSSRTDMNHIRQICTTIFTNPHAVVKAKRQMREKFVRTAGSFIFNALNSILFYTKFSDINGTPKAMKRSLYEQLSIDTDGDLFDLELLVRCRRKGIPVIEVPIESPKRFGGKSTTNLKSAVRLYFDSLKLRFKSI